MPNGVINELKKTKRTGLLLIIIVSMLVMVTLQGSLGLIAASVDENSIYVTALSMFFQLFFPVIVALIISISLYNEKRNEGILIYYYNAFSLTRVYWNKVCSFQIQALAVYVMSVMLAMPFIVLEGGNPLVYVMNNLNGMFYSVIGIIALVNIQFFISVILNNQILSLSIALLGTIGNFFVAPSPLWPYYPWSYLYRMLYHSTIQANQIVTVVIILLISLIAILLNTKRFKKNMLVQ
ncbi:ABC transporter permease [Gracilibacillus sp. S3-1-1]|uniref:ABC transporter permease n=1 Tax=Gracilibacillus pellucidus TaxID=3095368 RepID=A0ACC6M8N9_9BACI|nr:ABC transporter permease [Gracilibacillus sp. S3-1-1]MDX8047309.1 ABC transporter permease [Gracilibacillus sp. S3-1-1]